MSDSLTVPDVTTQMPGHRPMALTSYHWTRCLMYFAMDLKHNPFKKTDIDVERERREALRHYCQQDTWAMVEILRAVRKKIGL